ncbi:EAL domain-containing protein [Chthonobacter albigriseus]|uniref:EAL domain-containing protein n=1 Tax=Chthonobacter albigriseus TaxID=1683161 RepID=UPI001FCE3AB2|nr:EAL domain-containing protein [Chthonobacter albigriseus]
MDCKVCRNGVGFEIAMAFQPIVDIRSGEVHSFEALVRGAQGQSAWEVLHQITPENRYAFDQKCRVTAIETASRLGLACKLNINFAPNAVYEPRNCLRATLDATRRTGLPQSRLVFELTEDEKIVDHDKVRQIFQEYKAQGLGTAIDDFGAGYSQLNLLSEIIPDYVKIDMKLVRDIDSDRAKRAIVNGLRVACEELGVRVIAEGIETMSEAQTIAEMGITLLQGYLFARPGFEALPAPSIRLPAA